MVNKKKKYLILAILYFAIGLQVLLNTVIPLFRTEEITKPFFELFFILIGLGFIILSAMYLIKKKKE